MNLLAWAQPSYVIVVSSGTVDFIGNACHAITMFVSRRIARLVSGVIGLETFTFNTEFRKYVFSTAPRKSASLDTRHATCFTITVTALRWLCQGVF